jgi:hypothetical protein
MLRHSLLLRLHLVLQCLYMLLDHKECLGIGLPILVSALQDNR